MCHLKYIIGRNGNQKSETHAGTGKNSEILDEKKKKRQTLDGLKCVKGTTNRIMKTF